MKRFISVALLAALLAGCAHDSPCVPVYDDQGRLVHTNTCMKGTTQDNWEKWCVKPLGMLSLGIAYTSGKLKFKVGDYSAMVKNPAMAGPFIKSFGVMGSVPRT